MRSLKTFSAVLLSTTAILTVPARADASLAELQARLEKAQKENLLLKTEKVERENLTMKAEALEQENAKLRAEAGKGSAQAVAQSAPVAAAPAKQKAAHLAAASTNNSLTSVRRSVNRVLDNMPKDDPRRDMTAKAVSVSSVEPATTVQKSWTGIYAGINAGYGGNTINSNTATYSPGINGNNLIENGTSSNVVGGVIVGGQVGYNYNFTNGLVIGIETEMAYANINNANGSNSRLFSTYSGGNIGIQQGGVNSDFERISLDWFGSTRGRIGYSFPNLLAYVTGGLAYGQLSSTQSHSTVMGYNFSNSGGTTFTSTSGYNSQTQLGWAVGAGLEYKFADAWSIKSEYLYASLPGITHNYSNLLNGAIYSFSQTNNSSFDIHQARIGLNYHTDWLASKPVVVAKY
jgi:outer membrane immunogenic protein